MTFALYRKPLGLLSQTTDLLRILMRDSAAEYSRTRRQMHDFCLVQENLGLLLTDSAAENTLTRHYMHDLCPEQLDCFSQITDLLVSLMGYLHGGS